MSEWADVNEWIFRTLSWGQGYFLDPLSSSRLWLTTPNSLHFTRVSSMSLCPSPQLLGREPLAPGLPWSPALACLTFLLCAESLCGPNNTPAGPAFRFSPHFLGCRLLPLHLTQVSPRPGIFDEAFPDLYT